MAKPNVRDQAARLFDDGTVFPASLSDAEIMRLTCQEFMLQDVSEMSDSYISAAFKTLCDGDARMVQIGRAMKQKQQQALQNAPPASGLTH